MRLLGLALILAPAIAAADDTVDASTCQALITEQRWVELEDCGAALVKTRPAAGARFRRLATSEARAEVAARTVSDAIVGNDLRAARKALATIPLTSVYHQHAKRSLDDALPASFACSPGAVDRLGGTCTCPLTHSPARDAANAATCKVDPCRDAAAVAATEAKGDNAMSAGSFAQALGEYHKVVACKPQLLRKSFLAACRAKNYPRAKAYFKLLPEPDRDRYAQICLPMHDSPD